MLYKTGLDIDLYGIDPIIIFFLSMLYQAYYINLLVHDMRPLGLS